MFSGKDTFDMSLACYLLNVCMCCSPWVWFRGPVYNCNKTQVWEITNVWNIAILVFHVSHNYSNLQSMLPSSLTAKRPPAYTSADVWCSFTHLLVKCTSIRLLQNTYWCDRLKVTCWECYDLFAIFCLILGKRLTTVKVVPLNINNKSIFTINTWIHDPAIFPVVVKPMLELKGYSIYIQYCVFE